MRRISIVVGLSMLLLSAAALADVPGLISYQGTLTDEHGAALDTTVSMTFSVYTDSVGGSQVWTETQLAVAVGNGLFNVLLGSVNSISDTVFSDPARWLGVQVGVDPELTPRQRIAAVGYAFWAAEAETAEYVRSGGGGGDDGDWTLFGEDMYSAVSGNVGIGTDTPLYKLHVYHTASGNYGYMGSSNYGVYGQSSSSASAVHGSHSSGNYGYLGSNGYGVFAYSGNGYGVQGYHSSGNYGFLGSDEYGVYGDGNVAGVYGSGSGGYGVHGYSSANHGVYGNSIAGSGVYGSHDGGNYGFLGSSDFGVYAYSNNGYGVRGHHISGNYGYLGSSSYGVYGSHSSGNYGYIGSNDFGVRGYSSGGHAVYGNSSTGSGVRGSSTSGKGVNGFSSSGWAVYGEHGSGNYGSIGTSSHGMLAHLVTTDPGDYAVCGYGIDASGEDGTDYGASSSLGGVKGYNIYGNQYTFGVAGYSHLDSVRSGGCFGGREDAAVWGCFGYKNSAGTEYGGYATSWDSGGGKGQVSTGIGFGSWGELFGADIHGKVYGIYAEGGDYALFTNGAVFKNDIDVHLQDMEAQSPAVLYTNVSTDVTVQTSGFSTLSKGVSFIKFDDDFKKVVSPEVPIVVTVTPTGDCNGVHVAEVTKDGFFVVENRAGKSDVNVAFIAIGRRIGHENPKLPVEVISSDYVDRLSRGLHNDAQAERDGEGLYYENDRLYVGRYPSVLPDQQRPRKQLEELKEEHGELLEVQERETLDRKRMEEEARRMEEERLRMLELQRRESLERKRFLEAEEERKAASDVNKAQPERSATE